MSERERPERGRPKADRAESNDANACERIGVLMAEWISGELDAEDSAEVRAHLATCATCRTEESEMRGMIALLERDAAASSGVRDPGEAYWNGFAARVSGRLPAREKAASFGWLLGRIPRLATGLAAAAVLVIALNVPMTKTSPEDPLLGELLVESVAPPSLDGLATLGDSELDRLGSELAAGRALRGAAQPAGSSTPSQSEPSRVPAPVLDGLGDLSPEELDTLLERLDAFET